MNSTRVLIHFFIRYKYAAIAPIAILEGPIITIISGFLASHHVLSVFGAFLICFLGDLISDSVFYYFGRGGKKFIIKLPWLRITDERIKKIEDHYERSPWKTMIVAKVSYGLGSAFMIASGMSKMTFGRFLEFAGLLNALRTAILIAIGYYFGQLAIRSGPQYITYYTIVVLVIVPLAWLIMRALKVGKFDK